MVIPALVFILFFLLWRMISGPSLMSRTAYMKLSADVLCLIILGLSSGNDTGLLRGLVMYIMVFGVALAFLMILFALRSPKS